MLAHSQHGNPAGRMFSLLNQGGHRRHITILHRDPHRMRITLEQSVELGFLLWLSIKRLFTQDRQRPLGHDLFQLADMFKVRADNDQSIELIPRQQIIHTVRDKSPPSQFSRHFRQFTERVINSYHLALRQQVDVFDMLLPHHTAADQPIFDVFQHL